MKNTINSGLCMIMKIFNTKGYDLANAIHVDYSLISKWKTAKRRPSAIYLSAIAEYFINLDRDYHFSRIIHFIKQYYPNESSEEIISKLPEILYLCLNQSDIVKTEQYQNLPLLSNNHYSSRYDVFIGKEGRRQATLRFLNQAVSLPKGQTIHLISQEEMIWMTEDELFVKEWNILFSELLRNDCTINVIHTVDRSDMKNLISFIEIWLSQHMTGCIKSWYYPNYTDHMINSTLMIISREALISSHSAEFSPTNMYTAYYNDYETIKHYEENYSFLLKKCKPLVDVIPFEDPQNLVIQHKKTYHREGNTINFSESLTFDTMPLDLLLDVIEEQNVSKKLSDRLLNAYDELSTLRIQNLDVCKKFIYNLESIETNLLNNSMYCHDLSILLGKDIILSSNQFKRHVQNVIQLISNCSNCEVGLIAKQDVHYIKNINVWIKENNKMLITSTIPNKKVLSGLSITEPTFVNAYYNFYIGIWNSIPPHYHDKEYIVKALNSLIK